MAPFSQQHCREQRDEGYLRVTWNIWDICKNVKWLSLLKEWLCIIKGEVGTCFVNQEEEQSLAVANLFMFQSCSECGFEVCSSCNCLEYVTLQQDSLFCSP